VPNIDRRIIYIALIVAVVYAFMNPMGLPIIVGKYTRTAFNAIESLPPGSILVMGMDFSAGGIAELEPAGKAIFYQCMKNDVKLIMLGMWVMAGDMAERLLDELAPQFPDKVYGTDYINIGYKAGGVGFLESAVQDILVASLGVDHRLNPLPGNFPIFDEFKSLRDADFWVCLSTGNPGVPDWIKVVQGPLGIPGTIDVVSVSIPENMPFVDSGQLTGIIQGMRGSAEYELLVERPGRAVAGMDAQSLSHLVILFFIILGNIAYLVSRKK
jgi:hypothetical protein